MSVLLLTLAIFREEPLLAELARVRFINKEIGINNLRVTLPAWWLAMSWYRLGVGRVSGWVYEWVWAAFKSYFER